MSETVTDLSVATGADEQTPYTLTFELDHILDRAREDLLAAVRRAKVPTEFRLTITAKEIE